VPQSSARPIGSLYCKTRVEGLADFTDDTNDGATTTVAYRDSVLALHVLLGQRNTEVPGTATSVAPDADEPTRTTVNTTTSAAIQATRELKRATGGIRVSFSVDRPQDRPKVQGDT
jgi:hypothetical protein